MKQIRNSVILSLLAGSIALIGHHANAQINPGPQPAGLPGVPPPTPPPPPPPHM